MTQSPNHPIEPETDAFYTIDVIAELSGTDTKTVLRYQELGVITPAPLSEESEEPTKFDTEALRHICRLEQLRHSHTLSESGLKLVAELLAEIETLRQERRRRLH